MESFGTLQYGPGIKAAVLVDQGISDYYRSLIPKYYYVQPQKYPAHITVVRLNIEIPNMDHWGKYEGMQIKFEYDNKVHFEYPYFFLNTTSEQIGKIREELGLPKFRFAEISRNCYHITIANCKE